MRRLIFGTLSAIAFALFASQAGAQTVIVSRIAWARGLKIALTIPTGWVIVDRDPVSYWRQEKAYGVEIRKATVDKHQPAGKSFRLVFEKFWPGRLQRVGT